jgi:hypothetical protein
VVEILHSYFSKGEKNNGKRRFTMDKKKVSRGFTTFVKAEEKGKCPCCDKKVFTDQLYVEEDKNVYHFSCYNNKKAEEK